MRGVGCVAARPVAHLGPVKSMAPNAEAVATRKLKGEVIAFGEQVDSYARESLAAQTAMQDERDRIFLQACAVRMFRFFQAICALVTADLNDAAGAVLRNLLEQHYVLSAVRKDPAAIQVLANELSEEGHKAIKGLATLSPEGRPAELTHERLQEALTQLKQGGGFKVYDWARRAELTDSYHTLWRRLCDYAHGSPAMIDEYLETGEDGQIISIRSKVARAFAIEFILIASGILLDAVKALDTRPGSELVRARLDYLAEQHSRLYAEYHQLRGDPLADLGKRTA